MLRLRPACFHSWIRRCSTKTASVVEGVNAWESELTTPVKHSIEQHWRSRLQHIPFDESSDKQKYYVLSMFPYPSGQLHMGHVRVYSISDAIARFHRMRGQNVLHPMGWDAFGLPAENAARDRGIDPDRWTQSNIASMKDHMETFNFSFDWNREFATCDSDYYKWTQFLFLKMFENNLAYQKEALVNWDPIDQTVLAEEQVDSNGRSWRSGAKVEKRKLKQWFIRTTRFAKALYDGLDDPDLKDWKDIVKVQKHWIGECTGTSIDFEVVRGDQKVSSETMSIWLKDPELIDQAKFVAVKPGSVWDTDEDLIVKNPFTTDVLPVLVTDAIVYPDGAETYLGIPDVYEKDREFAESAKLALKKTIKPLMDDDETKEYRRKVCVEAKRRGIGGYPTNSKIRDWLISRQRYWGTPIPIVHCPKCGPQPVPEADLPVKLPAVRKITPGKNPLLEATDWLNTKCPHCEGPATRETDTMDTFVDSSWYYLRFLDPDNVDLPFKPEKSLGFMPVDIYVGGKEHAVLHLYYARFISHFLHSAGLLPSKEPFKRLLVQGMVKGRTYKSKATGEYVKPELVVDDKKSILHKETGETLVASWEKMSKSKFNGVDPLDMLNEFGVDTTRLIILADVAPTSSRNWSRSTFQGVLNWQHRLWITVQNFIEIRKDPNLIAEDKSDEFIEQHAYLRDSRNFYVKGATFNFIESYQLSVAISKMQGLTNSIRKSSRLVVGLSEDYEKALAAQIIMLVPLAPHFAAELWSGFISAPNRISQDILWNRPITHQPWPKLDDSYDLTMLVCVNRKEISEIKIGRSEFDKLRHDDAMKLAQGSSEVKSLLANTGVSRSLLKKHKDCNATLLIFTDEVSKKDSVTSETEGEEELVEKKKRRQ